MITHRAGIWIADLPYAAKDELKAAGWTYHGLATDCRRRACRACAAGAYRRWWTASAICVRKMNSALLDGPAALALDQQREVVEASHAQDAEIDPPAPPGLEYMPFQRAGIAYILKAPRRRVILGDEMGLGKCIESIGYMNMEAVGTALVVCPASLRINWLRELERWLVSPRNIHVVDSDDPPPASAEVVIVNYERVIRGKIKDSLMGWAWDLLICDEAHYLKTENAKRTVAVLGRRAKPRKQQEAIEGLIHRSRTFLALTGTALLNRPIELYTLLSAIDEAAWGDKIQFGVRYCAGHQKRVGFNKALNTPTMAWDFSGASHLDELQERLRSTCLVRRLKVDVLPELPPKRRELIVLDPKAARGVLAKQLREWNAKYAETFSGLQTEMFVSEKDPEAYASAVARLEAHLEIAFEDMSTVRKLVALAKVPAVIDHLQLLLEAHEVPKVVCWAHHHEVIDEIAPAFNDMGAITLDGRDGMKARQKAVDAFQGDASVRLLVAGIRAAGEGLTLTAASHEVFAELDWTPARLTQAEDRCHRIGQKNMVLIQHLVFDGSIDAMIAHVLLKKQAIADKVLNR